MTGLYAEAATRWLRKELRRDDVTFQRFDAEDGYYYSSHTFESPSTHIYYRIRGEEFNREFSMTPETVARFINETADLIEEHGQP